MATQVQYRRNDPSQPNTSSVFVGAQGEITVDLGAKTLRVHDGTTPGGSRLATSAELSALDTDVDARIATSESTLRGEIQTAVGAVLPAYNDEIDPNTGKAYDAGKVLTIDDNGDLAWVLPS